MATRDNDGRRLDWSEIISDLFEMHTCKRLPGAAAKARNGAARVIGRAVKWSHSALVHVANLSSAPNRLIPESIADCVYGLVQRLAVIVRVVE